MKDFIIENGVLRNYAGPGGAVTVPQGVSVLADSFFLCRGVTSVVLPEGVTVIEPAAFYLCENMISVTLPESLTEIGKTAFLGCYSLCEVTIPGSVEVIGARAFLRCGLRTVRIAPGVKVLETGAFRNCDDLTEIRLPDSVISIGPGAFHGCTKLYRAVLPATLKKMGNGVFLGCEELRELVAPGFSMETLREHKLILQGAIGYLCNPDAYTDPKIVEEYGKIMMTQRRRLVSCLVQSDRVEGLQTYAKLRKINLRNFERDFLQPAMEAGATACIAFLMNWKNTHISTRSAAKKRAQDWKL
ncbi:MAG: leucine-rich repeat domain-containing protein [Ruminococcaceae bacterium]|nr:leucine-rich repeat domain-containing protein [Oscillospiraceae bacterium]